MFGQYQRQEFLNSKFLYFDTRSEVDIVYTFVSVEIIRPEDHLDLIKDNNSRVTFGGFPVDSYVTLTVYVGLNVGPLNLNSRLIRITSVHWSDPETKG